MLLIDLTPATAITLKTIDHPDRYLAAVLFAAAENLLNRDTPVSLTPHDAAPVTHDLDGIVLTVTADTGTVASR